MIRRIKQLVAGPPARKVRNAELFVDYGDILVAETKDGDRVEIRFDRRKGAEFAKDFDRPETYARQRSAGMSNVAPFQTEQFQYDLEASDIAKTIYSLFRVAEGDLDIDEVNQTRDLSSLHMLTREQVVESLGFDPARSFRVNGVKFRLQGERFEVLSSGDEQGDAALSARIASQQQKLRALSGNASVGLDTEVLMERREGLFKNYRYAYFDFVSTNYEGTDRFVDVVANHTLFPDSVFFGLGTASEMLETAKVPQAVRAELTPIIANHVANDVLATALAIPPSTRDTVVRQVDETVDAFVKKFGVRDTFSNRLKDTMKKALDNIELLLSTIPRNIDPTKLRPALGADFRNGVYTVPRFSIL